MRKLFPLDIPFPPVIMPLAAAVLALAAAFSQARAAEPVRSFVIAAQDGYGISDCVASRQACGQVVADAWCEGHGLGKAAAFGSADDVTGSIDVKTLSAPPPRGSVIITCGD